MTLEREVYDRRKTQVRLVGCPFCGADLSGRRTVPGHLRRCDAFERAWRDRDEGDEGHDVDADSDGGHDDRGCAAD